MPYIYSAKTPSGHMLCDMAPTCNMLCVTPVSFASASETKLGLRNVELLESDTIAEDQLSTAPPSLSGDMAVVLQDAGDAESECMPQSRTKAISSRWADMMDDLDEEVVATCQEDSPWQSAGSQFDTLSQQASRVHDHNTTPSFSSSHSCHSGLSTDAPVDSAYSAQEWETIGEASGRWRQVLQTERGIDNGGKNGLIKGLTNRAGKAKGFGKGSTKGGRKCGNGKSNGKGSKCQCQFTIGIEEEKSFRVCNKLLGPGGQHVKAIAEATGAKLRLRGRGSRFLEEPDWVESPDPLMLCLSVPDATKYAEAKRLTEELLEDVYKQFRRFRAVKGLTPQRVFLDVHEGPREGSF